MLYSSNFNKFFGLILLTCTLFMMSPACAADGGFYYQIRVYHFKTSAQQQVTEDYLKNVFVPHVHQWGVKQIGVFKTLEADTADRRIYVFIPFKNWKSIEPFEDYLTRSDALSAGNGYVNADYKNPPYSRMETIILKAFVKMPNPAVPKLTSPKSERIYELRSYEGPTEKYYNNKVKMFNDGDEVGLFKRLGFNAVFYARVVAGSRMPNLMYMTAFNNKEDRDRHWGAFSGDPQWKTLSAMPEYQNNVSKGDIIFLYPAGYSDF